MTMQLGKAVTRTLRFPLLSLILLAALAGCGGRQTPAAAPAATEAPTEAPAEAAVETPATPTVEATQAPAAAAQAESPLVTQGDSPLALPPTSPLTTPSAPPTDVPRLEIAAGTGAVTGVLKVRSEQGVESVDGQIIALGVVLTNTEGLAVAVRYNAQESPQTNTDETGYFAINDVPPGRYGLILDMVMSSYILRKPDVEPQEDLFIDIQPGVQVDLGELVYDNLPLAD